MSIPLRSSVLEGGLTVDPTAGAGVPAAVGSIYPRRGSTEWWMKTGAADTAWTRVIIGPTDTIFTWGNNDIAAAADTRFLQPGRQQGTAPTTDIAQMPVTRAGTLRNLFVRHNANVGDGDNVVYTVQVNGVDTTITVTLASNVVAQASDLVHTAAVAQGDRLGLKAVKAAGITNGNLQVQATLGLF